MERFLVFSSAEIQGKCVLAKVAVRENAYKWKKQFACETLGYFYDGEIYVVTGNANRKKKTFALLTKVDPKPFEYSYDDLLRGIRNIDVSSGANAYVYFHGEPPAKEKKFDKLGREIPPKPSKDKKINEIVELSSGKTREISSPRLPNPLDRMMWSSP